SEACVWDVKRAGCLQRSVVATWMLRRHGYPAEMVIGCRPLPFESHAWVEITGRIVNDLPQYGRAFPLLHRLLLHMALHSGLATFDGKDPTLTQGTNMPWGGAGTQPAIARTPSGLA